MNILGYEISVSKKIPTGARPAQSLATNADLVSGRLDPRLAETGAPAGGNRPNAGPLPAPLDAPAGRERHAPIRWNYPYAYNQLWTPRRGLTPFAMLRTLADVSDLTRICIETRKDQICSLAWDIAPRDKKAKKEEYDARVNHAREVFRRPDRKRDFPTWLRMALEDIMVVDALAVYRRKTYGGELYALELKDGTTFLPLLDPTTGDIPDAPAIAYRQIINGIPMEGGDCSVDDLYYRPRTVRTHSAYGLSPTESVLLTISAALNRQVFNLAYYTDGNVPEGLIEAPEKFTTKQLIEFQEYLDDYLTGDLARRRRLKVVHQGSNVHDFKEPDFTGVYDEWLLKVHCAAFAVLPSEIGFTADVNKSTSDGQENATYRRGVRPMAGFLKGLFDDVLALDLQLPELEWTWNGGESEDKLKQAETDAIYVDMGKVGVDELRLRDGQDPIGVGPYISTAMGPLFIAELLSSAPDGDPTTNEADGGGTPAPAAAGDGTATPGPAGGKGSTAAPDTTLNGAQVSSLLEILVLVSTGQLPRDAGVRAIEIAFHLTHEIAEQLMGTIGDGFEPTAPTASAAAPAPPPPPPDATPAPAAVSAAAIADLRKWRLVALKAVKAQKPVKDFASEVIPIELAALVSQALETATTTHDVIRAFDTSLAIHGAVQKAGEARQLTKRELVAAKAMKRLMAIHFRKQGAALGQHLKDKLS